MLDTIVKLLLGQRTMEAVNMIRGLNNEERRELRDVLMGLGAQVPQNCYYNYETQEWV